MLAVYKKELRSYFTSMIGWVFMAFLLFFIGLYFMVYGLKSGVTNYSYVYQGIEGFFVILLVPVLTMRVVAEEKRQKTDQLLYTAPVSIEKIIAGKYLALLTLFGIAMAVASLYPLLFHHLVSKVATGTESVDYAIAYGSTLGFFLLGAAYIAIGMFISSLTESQLIAAVVSGVVMIFTYLMTNIAELLPSGHAFNFWFFAGLIVVIAVGLAFWIHNTFLALILGVVMEGGLVAVFVWGTTHFDNLLGKILSAVSITDRYSNFCLGIFDVSALVYYISVAFLFVFMTIQRIKKKRFN
ncbi:MAG: ABC transporter permease [Eubacterium sp.]|nr:ABC transporter permease [Eubacterium sp.]